ncbi:MAG: VapC toxin family PIN domain ribonuclease [Cyanobacteria bacterium K_DeepCast_35m_m2_023]|nr:VapC toxin family PIN domain ribonuclease [Cyanobacteria bacterium K_DeepCast_35m_m2_023]
MRRILVDSGTLLSSYQQQDPLHQDVVSCFDATATQLITSPVCIVEVLWLLGDPGDARVLAAQNHLLAAVSRGGISVIDLVPEDDGRIAELNGRYADLPADVAEILTLDSDFDVDRRFRREPFCRVPCRAGRNC